MWCCFGFVRCSVWEQPVFVLQTIWAALCFDSQTCVALLCSTSHLVLSDAGLLHFLSLCQSLKPASKALSSGFWGSTMEQHSEQNHRNHELGGWDSSRLYSHCVFFSSLWDTHKHERRCTYTLTQQRKIKKHKRTFHDAEQSKIKKQRSLLMYCIRGDHVL